MNKKTKCLISLLSFISAAAGAAAVYNHFLPPVRRKKKEEKYPFALLLGCAAHDDGSPSNSMRERTQLAIEAWQKGEYDVLIVSGGAVKNEFVEADLMADLIGRQVSMPVIRERNARNTWENFKHTREMIGDVPLLIITGDLHARRTNAIARQFFTRYAVLSYPDFKLRRMQREIPSRLLYIWLELQKKYPFLASRH